MTLELPVPRANALPDMDPFYQYDSIFHWQPLVNGYSGHYYEPYIEFLEEMRTFPSDRADDAIERTGAQVIIVHRAFYPVGRYEPLIAKLDANPKLQLIKDLRRPARARRARTCSCQTTRRETRPAHRVIDRRWPICYHTGVPATTSVRILAKREQSPGRSVRPGGCRFVRRALETDRPRRVAKDLLDWLGAAERPANRPGPKPQGYN